MEDPSEFNILSKKQLMCIYAKYQVPLPKNKSRKIKLIDFFRNKKLFLLETAKYTNKVGNDKFFNCVPNDILYKLFLILDSFDKVKLKPLKAFILVNKKIYSAYSKFKCLQKKKETINIIPKLNVNAKIPLSKNLFSVLKDECI